MITGTYTTGLTYKELCRELGITPAPGINQTHEKYLVYHSGHWYYSENPGSQWLEKSDFITKSAQLIHASKKVLNATVLCGDLVLAELQREAAYNRIRALIGHRILVKGAEIIVHNKTVQLYHRESLTKRDMKTVIEIINKKGFYNESDFYY